MSRLVNPHASSSCLAIFFSALAGIGYVEPDASLAAGAISGIPAPAGHFVLGAMVYDVEENEMSRRRKLDEQRELEMLWQSKKRPKDVSTLV